MKFIPWSFLLLVLAAGCKKDKPNDPGGSNTFISVLSYYYSTDPAVSPTNVTINYGTDLRIESISQTFPPSAAYDSWAFSYNADGSIAGVKGSGADFLQSRIMFSSTMLQAGWIVSG